MTPRLWSLLALAAWAAVAVCWWGVGVPNVLPAVAAGTWLELP